ncbi:MAG: XRE family transcriptional regulator [Cytophagales bacterium]|nr:MAG: XRE family transcriptional regulator [Cytophagales bacterium]
MNTQNETVGQNIRLFRERLALSQTALADYLGVSHAMISHYETGNRPVSTDHLQKLADLFGIDAYGLFETDGAQQQANLAFAFRADTMNAEDLTSIAAFRRIVNNYLKMKKQLSHVS